MKNHHQNRRDFLKTSAALGAAAAMPHYLSCINSKGPSRPNIILIMADDLGYECIGTNGGTSYKTPVLDKMAETGIRFEHCYSQPLCTPSRVQIMTGIYNVRNYVKFGILDRNQTTFALLLKNAGYSTCVAGKWQLGKQPDSPMHFGFDESCLWQHTRGSTDGQKHDTRYPNPKLETNGEPVEYNDGEYAPDVTSDFICDFMERHRDKPFFAYYPMILTHCPFSPTPDSSDWDPNSKGSRKYKGNPQYFGDMVTYMDKMVGKILSKLDELNLGENTLVLFTSDNGTDKPIVSILNDREVHGGKRSMTDAGTHVPLIASWPGVIPPGQVCKDLVDFSDFLPTLCEAAGTPVPAALNSDGRSFLPQLKGRRGNPRDWIYCWFSRNGGPVGQEWARNQQYKLYRTGEFFDISKDILEKNPLKINELGKDAQSTYEIIRKVLNKYRDARPQGLNI